MSETLTPEGLPTPTPGRYRTEEALTESLGRKGTAQPGPDLYPRDGTEEVAEIEEALSRFTIPGQALNVVVPSGMAGVGGAMRYALALKARERGEAPTLAHPPQLYNQSTLAIENLRLMGVSATGFEPGSTDSVDRLFDEQKADVIFAETVSNTPAMPVLNVHHLLERTREAGGEAPILVLDNTLPLSTGVPFDTLLRPDDRALIVESATKGPLHNSGHLGVVYGAHEELVDGFRKHKVTEGLVTSTGIDPLILEALETTGPAFHRRNRQLYYSTGVIATWLARAQEAQGEQPDIFVSFPTLVNHPNYDYVRANMDNGVAPVVFMDHPASWGEENGAQQFFKDLTEHEAVREQIGEGQVKLGQSFGFPEATLLYDPNATQVRVAGGYNIDSARLGKALYEALADLRS